MSNIPGRNSIYHQLKDVAKESYGRGYADGAADGYAMAVKDAKNGIVKVDR